MMDEFMQKRRRTYFLHDSAILLNTDIDHILKQVRNLKAEIEEMRREMNGE